MGQASCSAEGLGSMKGWERLAQRDLQGISEEEGGIEYSTWFLDSGRNPGKG